MKRFNTYIIEKLKLSKKPSDSLLDDLCEFFQSQETETEFLIKYCKTISSDLFKTRDEIYNTPIELLTLLAFMLVDDNNKAKDVYDLGYKKYMGKHTPYEYPWFEENVERINGDIEDVLDVCIDWIRHNFNEFEKIYEFIKKYKQHLSCEKIINDLDNIIDKEYD